jgi:hypothetical protein
LECNRLHHREPLIANATKEDREMKIELDNDEGIVELDGKHMFVVRNGVRIAKRENKKWVSLIPGVTVRDTKDKRHPGI